MQDRPHDEGQNEGYPARRRTPTSRATKGRSHTSGPGDGLEAYERGNEDDVEDDEAVRVGTLARVRVDDANTPINARRLLKQSRDRRAAALAT